MASLPSARHGIALCPVGGYRNKTSSFVKNFSFIHNAAATDTIVTSTPSDFSRTPNYDCSYFDLLDEFATNVKTLAEAQKFHSKIISTGNEQNVFFGIKVISAYANCGHVMDAHQLFDKMPESKSNILPWNALIKGYAMHGRYDDTLRLYYQMQSEESLKPNAFTFPFVLKACAGLLALQQGKDIHYCTIRSGLESNIYVGSALVDMYVKCGSLEDARQVFDRMSQKNVVSWTAIIAGYAQNGEASKALQLFRQMQVAGMKPNFVTMTSVLPACTSLSAILIGKEVHCYMIKDGFEFDILAGNALLDMYAKCCNVGFARQVFEKMSKRNLSLWNAMIVGYIQNRHYTEALKLFDQMQVAMIKPDLITWNAMISGCAQNGYVDEAFQIMQKMQLAGVKPTSVTMLTVLPLCSRLAALRQGKLVHGFIIRSGLILENSVGNALLDMYSKCGSIKLANQLFLEMPRRDVISWTAMIAGCGMHGHGRGALMLFHQMLQENLKPNHITFIGVLSACSHSGLVDEGWRYFHCMSQDHFIKPKVEHYACMVDLLSRAGQLDEAYDFIKMMPIEPDAGVWGALLGACRIYCNIELAEDAAKYLFKLEPHNSGNYVLLSNIYAESGKLVDAAKVREMMKDKGLKKTPGCSWIEINKKVYPFLVGDVSHPQTEEIYAMLKSLSGLMKAAGYVPDTRFALHDT